MRAWIVSDIHASLTDVFGGSGLRIPKADICICAGDVSNNIMTSIAFLRREIEPHMPIVLVLGNHDFYGHSIDLALERAHRETQGSRIHLLENQTFEIGDCRIVGATLWTDFAISVGDDEHIPPEERRAKASGLVPARVADFEYIYRSDARREGENGLITVRELLARHRESRKFIDRELEKPFDGRTIVLTHHAPHMQSLDPFFFGELSNAAFASDLSDLISRRAPNKWIHGHIHRFRDYMADRTRIICNPRGYGFERGRSGFRSDFVIDL